MSSLERILSFLGTPVRDLFADLDVTEVMINHGGQHVYIEKCGVIENLPGIQTNPTGLTAACRYIARDNSDDISSRRPILDANLEDGSRVAALFPPCSVDGITLTIRRFPRLLSWCDLCSDGTVPDAAQPILLAAVLARHNILISGETNSAKTTLLTALASHFPDESRIIVIEETAEIQIKKPHVLRFEARREQPATDKHSGVPAVPIGDLVRATMRHRPDRLVLGEVRGGEAFDLLQLLNTGHAGSISTIHANSAEQALSRLAVLVQTGQPSFPYEPIRESVAQAIQLVVHMSRRTGVRRIAEIIAIDGYDLHAKRFLVSHHFPEPDALTGVLGDGTRVASHAGSEGAGSARKFSKTSRTA